MFRPWPELHEDELGRGLQWLHEQIGRPYPFRQLPALGLLFALERIFPLIRTRFQLPARARVCIGLAAEFYAQCGRDPCPNVHASVTGFRDLASSPMLPMYAPFPVPEGFRPGWSWPYPPIRLPGPYVIRRGRLVERPADRHAPPAKP